MERTRQIASYAATLTGPVIVAGDFNLAASSPAMTEFIKTTKFTDHVAAAGIKTTLSAAHYMTETIACDYIFTSPDLEATGLRAVSGLVSDHIAIAASINIDSIL